MEFEKQKIGKLLQKLSKFAILSGAIGLLFIAIMFILQVKAPDPLFSVLGTLAVAGLAVFLLLALSVFALTITYRTKTKDNTYNQYIWFGLFIVVLYVVRFTLK
ncbi:hypothetical protein KG089_06035 [Carnobacteriaceae bacterium zg-ZUI252]|nr:hypothetical protein [Carnobacteriaceae bacterium zg-ZUI252]MBS4770470.1 hypothetical protein [Carnobacteriaceae bacterium zg-ZUI240]QTU82837.1 hypothetical protein J7S27_06080 [Carnobacteriaceae bacterium zg-C25]